MNGIGGLLTNGMALRVHRLLLVRGGPSEAASFLLLLGSASLFFSLKMSRLVVREPPHRPAPRRLAPRHIHFLVLAARK